MGELEEEVCFGFVKETEENEEVKQPEKSSAHLILIKTDLHCIYTDQSFTKSEDLTSSMAVFKVITTVTGRPVAYVS